MESDISNTCEAIPWEKSPFQNPVNCLDVFPLTYIESELKYNFLNDCFESLHGRHTKPVNHA